MTSFADKPHLRRLASNPRVGVCVDEERAQREDGERPNRQVRAIGDGEMFPDAGGTWTRRITAKYVTGSGLALQLDRRLATERIAIRLEPHSLLAVASI